MSTAYHETSDDDSTIALRDPATSDLIQDRWQMAVVAIGRRATADAAQADSMLADAAGLLAEALKLDYSGVALVQPDGTLTMQVSPARLGLPAVNAPQRVSDRSDESLAAFALSQGHPVAVPDMGKESRFRDPLLRRVQARSTLACPLKMGQQNYGALLVAHRERYEFTPHDLMGIEAIGHLITTTIARNRAEQALTEQLRFDAALLDTVDAVVLALDADMKVLNLNRAFEEMAGFSLLELRQRTLASTLVVQEEAALVQMTLSRLTSDSGPAQFECWILTKHGARRRIAWAFTRVPGGEKGSLALMGAGVDVTEKWELENRMQKSRAAKAAQNQDGDGNQPAAGADGQSADDAPRGRDRRMRPRRAYPYMQRMAPIKNGQMPALSDFQEVECNDIGAGGFSYFADTRPAESDVVVAFGSGSSQTYLKARVVHSTPTMHEGRRVFLVGCRYTGRHTYSR